jgi:hypothetical protein
MANNDQFNLEDGIRKAAQMSIQAPNDETRVAQLTSEAIKASTDKAVKQANDFLNSADKTADSITAQAEELASAVKEAITKAKGKLRVELKGIVEELNEKGQALASRADAFIMHCAESSTKIQEHHKLINGKDHE